MQVTRARENAFKRQVQVVDGLVDDRQTLVLRILQAPTEKGFAAHFHLVLLSFLCWHSFLHSCSGDQVFSRTTGSSASRATHHKYDPSKRAVNFNSKSTTKSVTALLELNSMCSITTASVSRMRNRTVISDLTRFPDKPQMTHLRTLLHPSTLGPCPQSRLERLHKPSCS